MQAPPPPDRALSTDVLVDAALQMADADGLDALSLRRLASAFGVTAMALYRHVGDKEHLLDLMAGRLLDDLDVGQDRAGTWQEELHGLGMRFLELVAAHPAAPFLLSRPFESPGAQRVSVALLGILDRAGFNPGEAVHLLQALTGMLLGPAVHRATYASAAARKGRGERPGVEAAAGGQSGWPANDEPGWPADHGPAWSADPDADRLVVDLWVAGVQGLAANRSRAGGA